MALTVSHNLQPETGPIYPWLFLSHFLCSVAVRDRVAHGVANHLADHLGPDHLADHLGPDRLADHLTVHIANHLAELQADLRRGVRSHPRAAILPGDARWPLRQPHQRGRHIDVERQRHMYEQTSTHVPSLGRLVDRGPASSVLGANPTPPT